MEVELNSGREEPARDCEARIQALLDIAAEIRAGMEPPLPTSDHSWLYDEDGLPA